VNIEGSTALITGANRGLGKAFARALLDGGAAKVYAGARNPDEIKDPGLIPVKLDVTSSTDVEAAARNCHDVNLLINNAGAMRLTPVLAEGAEEAMREEMEVNVFGVRRMMSAFVPVIIGAGGGAIANMLSVVSLYVAPFNGTYCVSKHAAMALTDGARIQLKRQNIHVLGIYAGFIDTDMTGAVSGPKTLPEQVAQRTLDGIRSSQDHVFGDAFSEKVWHTLRNDAAAFTADQQRAWDDGATPWSGSPAPRT
jgi:NAD(P)-dependent dehydrogenase (short-subunit alcohol dehydrogenase family)